MRIDWDEQRCASLGLCEEAAPELFEVGADGELEVLVPEPGEHRRALLQQAVAACPTGALRIVG